ncbi:unnamed protein product [Fusarium equiseti]|uniref:Aminoglycoside phosphotransferase domain-containing protein n=1 Tax=Fusarium equiseti TaxID=61235 RepID=A0A8J2ID14_FUSEQ|nr:unnamed protein product [Fusarium equiseti]
MTKARQNFDDVAWDKNDEAFEESQKRLRLQSICRKIETLAESVLGKPATLVSPIFFGGFNVLYQISLEGDASDIMVRVPCPDLVQFPEEKPLYEARTMAFLSQNTTIPIPTLIHHTSSSEIGPCVMMQRIKSVRDMSDALAIPGQDPDETLVLNHAIAEESLKRLYRRIAVLMVELSKPGFPRIGSLMMLGNGQYSVVGRPITQNMNNMIQLANIPRAVLSAPNQTYQTADEWYIALAEMHMAQLLFQHNDLVSSEDDCRNKFVARCLFYALARQVRLSNFGFLEDSWSAQSKLSEFTCAAPDGSDSFRLYCDDFRPVNLLLNEEDNIIAAID